MNKNNFFLFFFIFVFLFNQQTKSDSMFDMGKDIFLNKAVCSTCHTLKDAGSNGQIGPNLNEIRPDKLRIINAVTNGIGVMPAYEGELTIQEIESVAHYVSIAANE
tara:strand:- start:184 stop:501 length:318 start_codon:yes stop_codon:yes gene_type:complete